MTTSQTQRGSGLLSWASKINPDLNAKSSRHRIDDISFSRDYIVCTCAWKGSIATYQPHRKEMEPK